MFRNSLLLFTLLNLCKNIESEDLKLKQVLIFSRHNIRTPVDPDLHKYSPKPWPTRDQEPGHLTRKGALVEGYLGDYFMKWLKSEQLLHDGCPNEKTVYVYANSFNRTVATAEAFVNTAFKDCDVTVHHNYTIGKMDPLFDSIIRNTTVEYKNKVLDKVYRKIRNRKLKPALSELNKILDIKNSEVCKSESICDLTDLTKNNISYVVGQELRLTGPLYIANVVVDTFSMNYYDGLPHDDVAWGLLTPKKWKIISELGHADQNIRFRTVAKEIAANLVDYFKTTFLNYDDMPKIMLIVGHDFNQNSVIHSMDFKPFVLPNHYELYPIGGKIVFQRWTDNEKDYLKIEYIYPSWLQLRNGTEFSMDNQPERVLLQLKWCKVDRRGLCPWNKFINKLCKCII